MPSDDSALDARAFESLLDELLSHARASGADQADAVVVESRALDATVRNGEVEDVERAESRDLGLRVFVGKKTASVSSSDLSGDSLTELAERAIAMAKASPDEPYAGLAPEDRLAAGDLPELDLFDATTPDPKDLEERALAVEAAARAVPDVTKTDHAWAGWAGSVFRLATTGGFGGGWRSSSRHFGVAAIAERDGAMERDFDAHSARHLEDLKSVEEVGAEAGRRAAARLGGAKVKSGKRTVIFENRVAPALFNAFAGAISGPSVARGVSFLKNHHGQQLFAPGVNIVDDPSLVRGRGSRPFDGEGVSVKRWNVVEDGVLTTWLLNSSSARQLGLETTGHAARSVGGSPGVSPSNLWVQPGAQSRDGMIADIQSGLFVTEMFGPSLNANTGDWSVGVSGFLIEGGEITSPVSEITVAGNLIDIYGRLQPADDLDFRGKINSPSLRVDDLSVAGQ